MASPMLWSIALDVIRVGEHSLGRGHQWRLTHVHTLVLFSLSRVWGHGGFLLVLHGEWRWGGGLGLPFCSCLTSALPSPLSSSPPSSSPPSPLLPLSLP